MYLKHFRIRNFRAIEELDLDFKKGLNIIVGENNSGKTAIIDALRLSLSDFQHPKDIYCSISDFRIDRSNISDEIPDIRFDLIFVCEKEIETAWFNDLHGIDVHGNNNLQLHLRFKIDIKSGNIRRSVWGGEKEGGKVSHEVRSALRNVYLSATRNTNRDLKPVKGNILGKLYRNIGDEVERDALLDEIIKSFVTNDKWQNFVGEGHKTISKHLQYLTYLADKKNQEVKIRFAPYDFERLVQNLIFQIPVYPEEIKPGDDQKYFDIYQNGLGYNNLIYTAAVLGDIKQRTETFKEEYTILLIEEPEAHLHPQLQTTFFNYLKKLHDDDSFQIIVTSHSPTITAKTDLKLLTILQNSQNQISATQIKKLDLDNENVEFLQKFLDVTKSQLFFSNGVILVEGVSEALLIPLFSKIMGEKFDLERNGIEVVNINGVAFKHFAKLFNSKDGKHLQNRCAIITDDDRGTSNYLNKLDKIESLQSGNLTTFMGKKTFEYELFLNNHRNNCLLDIIKKLHRDNFAKITDPSKSLDERADILVKSLSDRGYKSKFSYMLSIELAKDDNFYSFKVPEYIRQAIKFVANGQIPLNNKLYLFFRDIYNSGGK